jgi:hypothetical protein
MKPGDVSALPDELSWVDHNRFSEPIHVSARDLRRLMDMAMKGQKRLIPLDEGSDRSTSRGFSSLD